MERPGPKPLETRSLSSLTSLQRVTGNYSSSQSNEPQSFPEPETSNEIERLFLQFIRITVLSEVED